MDGFRERLSGRYDRLGARTSGYDRMGADDRFEGDRFERAPRRGSETLSQEAVADAVTEAVGKSNREQLDVIADFFDEAKADRMESERAIIDALSHSMNEIAKNLDSKASDAAPSPAPIAAAPAEPIAVVDEQNAETLARIERIAGQNAEALNENGEILERNINTLRSNSEVLSDIKSSLDQFQDNIRQSIGEISSRAAAPAQVSELTVDFSEEKNEIIGAVGDNRAILNMIRQDVLNGFAKTETAEENAEEKVIPLSSEDAAAYYKELEEHVHKECVKCYRNVQSALTEQASEANTGLEKSIGGTRIMALLAVVFSVIAAGASIAGLLMSMGVI